MGRMANLREGDAAMPRAYSADLRERALAACEAGLSPAAAARRFGVGERTVYDWRRQARDEGRRRATPPAGGRRPTIAGTEDALRAVVAARRDGTLAEYVAAYRARTGRTLSRSAMCRALRRLGLPRKRKSLRAEERDRPAVVAERAAFAARGRGLGPGRLVFVDEAGVSTGLVRTHARAPRGCRATGAAPAGRWRRLTVLGALAADGVAAAMTIERATDTAVFTAFLDQVLIPELVRTRPDAVVVMDNLSPHRAPVVRRKLEAAGLGLLHLPRYAPDLAPIEPMGAKVKALLRSTAARTVAALETALADALACVTPADARGFFRGCGYAVTAD